MTNTILPHNHGDAERYIHLNEEFSRNEQIDAVAELFRQMADPVRVRIYLLLSRGEECVINISALLGMTSPAVSHHLRTMKECGLLDSRRDGKEVYYRIGDSTEARLFHEMLETLMRHRQTPVRDQCQAPKEEIAGQIHQYLLDHLSERITIEKLSKCFHINSTSLKQQFKDLYGMSIAAHMHEHRMEKAAQLLTNSKKEISEIAKDVGFISQSRFTSAFKSFYHCTPTEYRRRHHRS